MGGVRVGKVRGGAHVTQHIFREAKKQNRWSLPVGGSRHKIKEDKWEGEESRPHRVGEVWGGEAVRGRLIFQAGRATVSFSQRLTSPWSQLSATYSLILGHDFYFFFFFWYLRAGKVTRCNRRLM